MKVVLLHGPAISSSRGKLIDIKKKFDPNNVVTFEDGVSVSDILASLQSVPMFGEERLIIVENPTDFELSAISYQLSATLFLWFDHEIDPKKWPEAEIFFFPEAREVSVFPFLDLLATKNKNAFLEIEKLKNANFDIFYFNTMVFYLLRNLIVSPKAAPQFVKDKLKKQRQNFTSKEIVNLYKEILEIEFKLKSGLLDNKQAEFYLVNKFTD